MAFPLPIVCMLFMVVSASAEWVLPVGVITEDTLNSISPIMSSLNAIFQKTFDRVLSEPSVKSLLSLPASTMEAVEGAVEILEEEICTGPTYQAVGEMSPTCYGPRFNLQVSTGECAIINDGKLFCLPPHVVFEKFPGGCGLTFTTPVLVKGKECKIKWRDGRDERFILFEGENKTFDISSKWQDLEGNFNDLTAKINHFKENSKLRNFWKTANSQDGALTHIKSLISNLM